MNIRPFQKTDLKTVKKVCKEAFADEENTTIMDFVENLSSEQTNPPVVSLVSELGEEVIGYVSFSPIFFHSTGKIKGYILAPLAVSPDQQKQGVGTKLIDAGKQTLFDEGVDVLLVYGDPAYYGRFGFKEETARLFIPPYPLNQPFGWQGMALSDFKIGNEPMPFDCVQSLNKKDLW